MQNKCWNTTQETCLKVQQIGLAIDHKENQMYNSSVTQKDTANRQCRVTITKTHSIMNSYPMTPTEDPVVKFHVPFFLT